MRITEIAHRGRGSEHLFLVLVAIACGLAGALGAVLFRTLIQLFQEAFSGVPIFWRELFSGRIVFGEEDPRAPGIGSPSSSAAGWIC